MSNDFLDGLRRGFAFAIPASPFAILFGALAIDNGFTVGEAVLMSASVFGGASQMVGLEFFGQKAAPWLIVLAIFAVNFRHVLYSAALGRRIRHFSFIQKALAFFVMTDPQFAEAETRAEKGQPVGFLWYMALGLPIYVFWTGGTWLGAEFGKLITNPRALGIDMLLPIYFLALVVGFRKRPRWAPVVAFSSAASALAYATIGSPWHLTVGAVAGVTLAALLPPEKSEPAEDHEPLVEAGE